MASIAQSNCLKLVVVLLLRTVWAVCIVCWFVTGSSGSGQQAGATAAAPPPVAVENPNKAPAQPQQSTGVFDVRALASAARPAVALITVNDKSGKPVKTGTGFFVSKDGKLITNAHVMEGAASATAKLENGATYVILGVLNLAVDKDLVLLQADAKDVPNLTVSGEALPDVGARVAVIGSPLGLEGSVSEGIISGHRLAKKDDEWLQMTAPVSPGSSGSPVVDDQGKVVGVATFVVGNAQALNFARPVTYVTQLLKQVTTEKEPAPLWTIAREPKNVVLNDPDFVAADTALHKDDPAGALKILNGLISKYPENESLLFEFGLVYDRLNLLEDAVGAYQRALKLEPTSGVGWTNLGLTLVKLHRLREAKDAARQGVKLAPDLGFAWALLGMLYSEENRLADAADALQKAAKLTPNDAEIWRQLSAVYTKLNNAAGSQQANAKLKALTAAATPPTAGSMESASVPNAGPAAPPVPKEKYTELVTTTLRGFEERNVGGLMAKYARKIAYQNYGVVDQDFVRQDLQKYFVRWPMTRTRLLAPVEVLDSKKPDEKIVRFRYEFRAASPDRRSFSVGTAWTVWNVWETPEGLKVFGEAQKVVRRPGH